MIHKGGMFFRKKLIWTLNKQVLVFEFMLNGIINFKRNCSSGMECIQWEITFVNNIEWYNYSTWLACLLDQE
jgi:hypothetical protein